MPSRDYFESTPVLLSSRKISSDSAQKKVGAFEPSQLDHLKLFHAFYHGHMHELRQLLQTTMSPNEYDGDGNSLLHLAVEDGNQEMVEMLLQDDRTDINFKNCHGQSPLIAAVMMNDLDLVKVLVKAGADLNVTDISGKTALLHALEDCTVDIAEYLIHHGCDVNIVDNVGQSAFYLVTNALDLKCVKIVKKLLKAGYVLEKDRPWMEEEGLDVRMIHSKNFVTKLIRKIAGQIHKLKVRQNKMTSFQTHPFQRQLRVMKIYE